MREFWMLVRGRTAYSRKILASLFVGLCATAFLAEVNAESLFRTGIAYQTTQAYTPKSLFAFPRPKTVGDIVTININNTSIINMQNTATLEKKHEITENGTQIANNIVKKYLGMPQFFPKLNGLDNQDKTTITGRAQKLYNYTDSVTCQVIQILPNGNLVVQGKKTVNANQEEQDLYVMGVVNPYYLDLNNAIPSQRVANLQINVAQRGMASRLQGDGVWGKYFRFFN